MRLFPAKATAPDGTVHEPVAVFESAGRVRVVAHDQRPVLLVDVDGVMERRRVDGSRSSVFVIATADGEWTVGAGRGCGCGHPLKRLGTRQLDTLVAAG